MPYRMYAKLGRLRLDPKLRGKAVYQHVIYLSGRGTGNTVEMPGVLRYSFRDHHAEDLNPRALLENKFTAPLAPLSCASDISAAALLRAAVLVILRDADSSQQVEDLLNITSELAAIVLSRDAVDSVWREVGVPVDLSQTNMAQSFRAEGRAEGQVDTLVAVLRHRQGLAEDQLAGIASKLVERHGDEASFAATVTPVNDLIGLLR